MLNLRLETAGGDRLAPKPYRPPRRSAIAKKAALAMWAKMKKAKEPDIMTIENRIRVFAFNGRYLVQPDADVSGFKTRGHIVAESVGGRWIKRSRGHVLTPKQFEQFKSVMAVLGPVIEVADE